MASAAKKKTLAPEMATLVEKAGGAVNDQGNIVFTPERLLKLVGQEKFEEMVVDAAESTVDPTTWGSMIGSTWNNGIKGKVFVFLAGVGAIGVGGIILEGIGAITNVELLRVITKATGFLHV